MIPFQTELKVGIFTAFTLVILLSLGIFFGTNPFSKKDAIFYTTLDNVGGIGTRTLVRVSGVYVGEVSDIQILPKGAKIYFTVNNSVPIPKGSQLELKSRGILGDVYLEILRNESEKEFLPSGSYIPRLGGGTDLSSLMTSLGDIAKDVKTVTAGLSNLFTKGGAELSLKNILHNVENITAQTDTFIAQQKATLSSMIEHAHKSAENIEGLSNTLKYLLSPENQIKFNRIVASTDTSLEYIKTSAQKIAGMVEKVERGEGTLGQIVSKNDTANDIREALKGVKDVLKPLSRIRINVDYKAEMRNKSTPFINDSANHFTLRVQTSPDKSYILGLTDSPGAQKITTSTITDTCPDNGPQTNCSERQIVERTIVPDDRARLRYNIQFAKRYEWLGLRFGLFESYAGFAGDVFLFSNRLQASMEAFQFKSTGPNPSFSVDNGGVVRLKTYMNFFLTPNVYTTLGADNLIRSPSPISFMGAGLHFNDDDLKGILGMVSLAR